MKLLHIYIWREGILCVPLILKYADSGGDSMKKNKGLRRTVGLFIAIVMVFTSVSIVFANSTGFTDISGHWAEDIIIDWTEMEIVRGYGDTFKPDNFITRAEFMALMNKTFFEDITDEELQEADVYMVDVAEDAWYSDVVKKAVVAGYISGYGEGIMKPGANITRQEVATIFSKVFELEQDTEATKVFADINSIDTWARGHVGAIAKIGFMTGYTEGNVRTFKGNQNITRAEAVVVLDNVFTILLDDLFDGLFDEDFDFESILGDISNEELLAILKDLFGDFLGEDFFINYESLTEEEVEVYLQAALEDLEARLNNMTEEEAMEILENIFGSILGDFEDTL